MVDPDCMDYPYV
jgi:uncharacterized membrane protein YfcA